MGKHKKKKKKRKKEKKGRSSDYCSSTVLPSATTLPHPHSHRCRRC